MIKLRNAVRSLVAVIVVLGVASFPAESRGEGALPLVPPGEIISQRLAETPDAIGAVWTMGQPATPDSRLVFEQRAVETDTWPNADAILCTTLDQSECAPRPTTKLAAQSVLGVCRNDEELGCLESVKLRVGTDALSSLSLVGYTGSETVFEESRSLGIPRGSSFGRWRAGDGSEYLVMAEVNSFFKSKASSWERTQTSFVMSVLRIRPGSTVEPGRAELQKLPFTSYKIATSRVDPPSTIQFEPNTRIELGVRLPNIVSGWFNARLRDGTVSAKVLDKERTSYTVAGDVANVYVAGNVVKLSALPPNFLRSNNFFDAPAGTSAAFGGQLGEAQQLLDVYAKWLPYIGDKALTTRTEWVVRGVGWTGNSCFSGGTGVAGLLATNAAMYNGVPPTWNEARKSLDFTVASPHVDENGQDAVGVYTLSIPSGTVGCLYGKEKLPAFAEISVMSGSDGADFTSTLSLAETSGWLNFSATGFHYSQPTISVRLTDTKTTASPSTKSRTITTLRVGTSGRRVTVSFVRPASTSRYSVALSSPKYGTVTARCRYVKDRVTCTSAVLRPGSWKTVVTPDGSAGVPTTRTVRVP